jgi:hypothetical protein
MKKGGVASLKPSFVTAPYPIIRAFKRGLAIACSNLTSFCDMDIFLSHL